MIHHIHNIKLFLIRSILLIFLMGFSIFLPAQSLNLEVDEEGNPILVLSSEQETEDVFIPALIENASEVDYGYIPALADIFEYPEFRFPSEEKIEKYRKDNRFQYDTTPLNLNWLDRFIEWILDRLDFITLGPGLGSFWSILGYAFILILVILFVFLILKLFGVDYRTILGRKKLDTPPIDIYAENVHEMDFDTLISNALKNKDYRLVIRFMYLKNLKFLTDKGFIKWDINKTNTSYLYEIADNEIRDKFIDATFIFDYVWYGEFPIDEDQFSIAYSRLDKFNEMLKR